MAQQAQKLVLALIESEQRVPIASIKANPPDAFKNARISLADVLRIIADNWEPLTVSDVTGAPMSLSSEIKLALLKKAGAKDVVIRNY